MDFTRFAEWLAAIDRDQRTRALEVNARPQGVEIDIGGQRLLNFSSNDYLGLAGDHRLVAALTDGARRFGVGAGAASLLSGYNAAHHRLAEQLAALTGRDRALVFSSGYMANLGLLSALVAREDRVISDQLNHASLIDGIRLARATTDVYPHADLRALGQRLAESRGERAWVVTDGLFSMDGDLAPLPDIARLASPRGACVICDDAHGFGVLGNGNGTLAHFGLTQHDIPLLVVTFGKALGTAGAAVIGPDILIETILQRARTFIYDTAMSPALAHATSAALDIVHTDPSLRQRLFDNIAHFRRALTQADLPASASTTPIQPLLIGDGADALRVAEGLRARGLYVRAIRPPTVPPGTARLRICLSAAHDVPQIDRLVDALASHRRWFKSVGLPG